MSMNSSSRFQENTAVIGAGVSVKGDVSAPELIVVDGEIDGDVSARIVRVGASGVIRGSVAATEADIRGLVIGPVDAEQLLSVRAGGRVEGRISYGEIELEKGAVVAGDLSSNEGQQRPATRALEKPAALEIEAAPAPKTPRSSLERINEAVRFAKSGGKAGALYLASDADRASRGNPLMRLGGRKKNG